jgi:uncharacterized membrane protein
MWVMVMMVVVVVMVMVAIPLRLRRIRNREAEDESQSEQILFHVFRMTHATEDYRATLTGPRKRRFLCESAHGICFKG